MLIHNKKEIVKLKRYSKLKSVKQYISLPKLALLFTLGIVFATGISHEYLNYKIFILGRQITEFFCYSVWCIISLYISSAFIRKRPDSMWLKLFVLFCGAFLSTLVVFLLNSFWHYLDFNSMFNWKYPVVYWLFIKSDLLYAYNFGWIRYPSVFLCVFATGMFLNSKFVLKIKKRIQSKIKEHNDRYIEIQLTELENETHSAKIIPFRSSTDSKED